MNGKNEEVVVVPRYVWDGVRVRHADADEFDPTEDCITTADKATADESQSLVIEDVDVISIVCRNMRMSTEPGYIEPALHQTAAKLYARSAAPTYRGNMLGLMLNISDKTVLA
ncbi:MAG: hypothetical protein AAB555_00125 [Patescibacteria group bacterium]